MRISCAAVSVVIYGHEKILLSVVLSPYLLVDKCRSIIHLLHFNLISLLFYTFFSCILDSDWLLAAFYKYFCMMVTAKL